MGNRYKNIIYINLTGQTTALPDLEDGNFSEHIFIEGLPYPPPFASNMPETDLQQKYEKKLYAEMVNDACHEGASIIKVKNHCEKFYYICSTCSLRTVGDTIEEAIQLMAERIMYKIDRGETGQC